jgi:formate-dependent nitrite reductase membrane component NrfD
METFLVIFLFLVAISAVAYGVYAAAKNDRLTKRQKTNLIFLICILPVLGTVIYFLVKDSLSMPVKRNM